MGRGKWTIAAAIAAVLVLPLTSSAADADAVARMEHAREEAARQLEAEAESDGALGIYWDDEKQEHVVVLPEQAQASAAAERARARGLSVRTEHRPIDKSTINKIDKALLALRKSLPDELGYVYFFNPESGVVEIGTDAPKGEFASIEKEFPGKVAVRTGVLETTAGNWTSDTTPHWGGAYLQSSSRTCTSGFAIKTLSDNKKYMVTAGHCFTHGTTTNMGKAWREPEAYPAIDVELIQGKTYAGYVYADGATLERRVNDGNDPVIGSSYCYTGRNRGFSCGWVAKTKGVTHCFADRPEGCTKNLFGIQNGSALFQLGDSGGPFYIKGGSLTVGIRGILSGRYYDPFTTWNFVQGYKVIANYYHAVIVTS